MKGQTDRPLGKRNRGKQNIQQLAIIISSAIQRERERETEGKRQMGRWGYEEVDRNTYTVTEKPETTRDTSSSLYVSKHLPC